MLVTSPTAFSQPETNWLRISTGDDSTLEVERNSLTITNASVSAKFRSSFSKKDGSLSQTRSKYSIREDLIEFSSMRDEYRVVRSEVFGPDGSIAENVAQTNGAWKSARGRTASLMSRAIDQLKPFGKWVVKNYRFASGESGSGDDPAELKALIGSTFVFERSKLAIGKESCTSPTFEPTTMTNAEFLKLSGYPLTNLGFGPDRIDAIHIVCSRPKSDPLQTYILKFTDSTGLLLWDGVFLEVERPPNHFSL